MKEMENRIDELKKGDEETSTKAHTEANNNFFLNKTFV